MKIFLFLFLLLSNFLFANGNSFSNSASIDSLLDYLSKEDGFSGRVELQKAGKIIYSGNFNKFSNNTNQFKIGSVTKIFTALLIYQLVDENKLSLKTKIDKFFPSIKYSNAITIENLLSHTSGVYSVTEMENYYLNRLKNYSRNDLVEIINTHKPSFKPNKDCSYSNSNYILLGYIIEDITQKKYSQILEEKLCKKIGLENTYCEADYLLKKAREESYKFDGEKWEKDVDSNPSLPFAAGAIVSNCSELNKMISKLFAGEIISDSLLIKMKTLRSKSIGHGIFRAPFYKKEGWGHTGRIDEFRAFVGYFPEDSLAISITSNGLSVNLNKVIIGVLSKYFGTAYKYPEFVKTNFDGPDFDIFVGNYRAKLFGFIPVAKLNISKAGKNHLYLSEVEKGLNSEKSLLERKDKMVFYSRDAGGELTFVTNKKGKVTKALMKQGKMTIKCKKLKR